MAGLLAAAMLRKDCQAVMEFQPSLPDNHASVLRFRSSVVGDALNIPFKKVQVGKAVHPWKNPLADALAYSRKTNGSLALRSLAKTNGLLEDRWVAPADFIDQMGALSEGLIKYNNMFDSSFVMARQNKKFISTIPMPEMMKILGWSGPTPVFRSRGNYVVTATLLDCDVYLSLYVPDPTSTIYRVSITGNQMIVECTLDAPQVRGMLDLLEEAMDLLGCPHWLVDACSPKATIQKCAKILPIDPDVRKAFLMYCNQFGIYSLGRFATWRPDLLMDDLVNDVRVIQRLVAHGSYDYQVKK